MLNRNITTCVVLDSYDINNKVPSRFEEVLMYEKKGSLNIFIIR